MSTATKSKVRSIVRTRIRDVNEINALAGELRQVQHFMQTISRATSERFFLTLSFYESAQAQACSARPVELPHHISAEPLRDAMIDLCMQHIDRLTRRLARLGVRT